LKKFIKFAIIIATAIAYAMVPFGVLSAARNTQSRGSPGASHRYPCGVDVIYKGGLVNIDANGYAMAATDTASEWCAGVADETVDNSGGSAGDKWVRVISGRSYRLAATSITQAMLGEVMYVVDDQTFDDGGGPTNDVPVGTLMEFISVTEGWVYIPEGGSQKVS